MSDPERFVILHVEDDDDHAELVAREFESNSPPCRVERALDGEEALDYLRGSGRFADRSAFPMPGLVLLDLRLPKLDGIEVLRTIKVDPSLWIIPVVMLTTSDSERDVYRAYEACVNSYIVKPFDHVKFRELISNLGFYWMSLNLRPTDSGKSRTFL
jgi:CheY-like chemotaxis protein